MVLFGVLEREVLVFVSKHLGFNDLLHALGVVGQVKVLAEREKLCEGDKNVLVMAAYFHDYTKRDGKFVEHAAASARVAQEFLKGSSLSAKVVETIKSHSYPITGKGDKPKTKVQLLLIEADMREQLSSEGMARVLANNLKQGMSYEEAVKDLNESLESARSVLGWVVGQLPKRESTGCSFCCKKDASLVLKEYSYWVLSLSRSHQVLGWCHVFLKRHAEQFEELADEELLELKKVVKEWKTAMRKAFSPDWFNVMQLGNMDKHLHFQLVPRYREKRVFEGKTFIDEDYGGMIIGRWVPEGKKFLMRLKEELMKYVS